MLTLSPFGWHKSTMQISTPGVMSKSVLLNKNWVLWKRNVKINVSDTILILKIKINYIYMWKKELLVWCPNSVSWYNIQQLKNFFFFTYTERMEIKIYVRVGCDTLCPLSCTGMFKLLSLSYIIYLSILYNISNAEAQETRQWQSFGD